MTETKVLLETLIQETEKFMKSDLYGFQDISHYQRTWKKLETYAKERGERYYSVQLGCDFLRDCYQYDLSQDISTKNGYVRRIYRYIRVLSDFYLHGVVYKHQHKECVWPKFLEELFEAFLKYLQDNGKKPSSMKSVKSFLHRLAQYLSAEGIDSFSNVNEMIIEGFVGSLSDCSRRTIVGVVDNLRLLLDYAYEKGYHDRNMKKACPRVREYKNVTIPATFSETEIQAVLDKIDRNSPVGLRDYAIILTAIRLGLRESDILNLCFSDIDWENGRITILQQKTGIPISLPLLDDVAWAIIDYLRNGRPCCDCDYIFVRHNSPITKLRSTYDIVQKYLRRAQIALPVGKRHGLHAMRHSLASKMLEQEIAVPIISGVLGHLSTDTTKFYLKIDINHLRRCALEVE